jgi:hypothetical protein
VTNIDDLLGIAPVASTAPAQTSGMDAMDRGVRYGSQEPVSETEEKLVKNLMKEYTTARAFDAAARKQYAKDRLYAAGRADPSWASDANLIGANIDILTSFMYSRNPDVSVRAAERVSNAAPSMPPPSPINAAVGAALAASPTLPVNAGDLLPALAAPAAAPPVSQSQMDNSAFAATLDIVIPRVWRDGRLKRAAKKVVRSSLSVGPGWMKALAFSQTKRDPQVEKSLNDAKAALERLRAQQARVQAGEAYSGEKTLDVLIAEAQQIEQGIMANLDKVVSQGMTFDFVRAEDIQVSLDVSDLLDYLDAGWIAHDIYIPKDDLKVRFPELTDTDCKSATCYYQKAPSTALSRDPFGQPEVKDEGAFSKDAPGSLGSSKPVEFAKIIELWDKRDGLIKTLVDGVKRWAVSPYAPPQATSRFYPYFGLAFYEVDGERHPQSLSFRLAKLQDEYASARSNQRITRTRSIPSVLFDRGNLSPEDLRKVESSEIGEYVGIAPQNAQAPMNTHFAAKPVPSVDPRIFDTSSIIADMERVGGIQEALSSSVQVAKTATEAEIQNTGFQSRTGLGRDALEEMLSDLAQYSAEVLVQEMTPEFVQRIAGPEAFWPAGMDVQDILTLVNVQITAGSTGKPNRAAERESWSVVLPMIQNLQLQIRTTALTDPPLADAMKHTLRETLRRLDERIDIELFIPSGPPPLPMPGLVPPGAQGGETGGPKPLPGASPPGGSPPSMT